MRKPEMYENTPKRREGFTLVETLLSLALFVLIMSMVASIFHQFLSSTNRMTSVMSTYDGVRVFSTQITQELGTAMVRVNKDRWLNLKVEEIPEGEGAGTRIFFTAPDDNLRSIDALNFISHYVYVWDKEEHALFRAVYNTRVDPEPLARTGSSADNKDRRANQERLTRMTLAYRSGEPYGWTESKELEELMEQEAHEAIVKNVFDFQVHCYEKPKSDKARSRTVWEDHTKLPLFIELELFVAHTRMVAGLRQEIKAAGGLNDEIRKKLRRFVITVPLRNHGIYNSKVY